MKVLLVGMNENPGGVESFVMNYYRRIDRKKIQIDFLCNTLNKIAFEDELLASGARVFHFTPRSQNPRKSHQELEEFFKHYAQEYDVLWANLNSLTNIDYLKMAKKFGIKRRIIHSHNSQNMDSNLKGKIREILHHMNKRVIKDYATDFWACSSVASDWFFDSKVESQIILNAIETENYAYDAEKARAIREKLGWKNNYVIGNIGRLQYQKNQFFLLDILVELLKVQDDYRLVLVGQGEDEQALKDKVSKLNLSQYVYFAGVQSDIQAWLSSFDLFAFPSRFEGLSIAALEAQANGLPMLASKDCIVEETKVLDSFTFYPLDQSAKQWAGEIVRMRREETRTSESIISERFDERHFNVSKESQVLERMLLGE